MKKSYILFTATITKHILRFHLPYLEWFQQQGYETHVASLGKEKIPFCDRQFQVDFVRSPYSFGHRKSYKQLKSIISNANYTIIHCHTPMASIITRLSATSTRKSGTKILYTAHGFHFFKGASLFNWMFFYPIEKRLSAWCDGLITINNEDFEIIRKNGSQKTQYFLIPGIGVEQKRFKPVDERCKQKLREKNGFVAKDLLLVYAAEFIDRKNHLFLIRVAEKIKLTHPNVKFLFAGRGELHGEMIRLVDSNQLNDSIKFLGFRTDIDEVFQMSDIGISASKQEGLGLNLIEEMMCEKPVVATDDRGHREIVFQGENGYLFKQNSIQDFIDKIELVLQSSEHYQYLSKNAAKTSSRFELANSLDAMSRIYKLFI